MLAIQGVYDGVSIKPKEAITFNNIITFQEIIVIFYYVYYKFGIIMRRFTF
jgi:hypothetical protein